MSAAPPPLALRDVGVSLGGLPILRHVSAHVADGEFVALLGGNGSGKTTFVRAALGLVPHQSGTIELFGTEQSSFKRWGRVGYVPQRASVNHMKASVAEMVGAGRLAHRTPFLPLDRRGRAIVDDAIERVGLSERRRDEVAHLSGGQQQRVLIARALAAKPDLMVLDEPLAGVDLATQEALAELIGSLNADGMSVLIVLHELGAFGPLLQRGIVLHDGRVVSDGPLTDVPEHLGRHEIEDPWPSPLVRGAMGEDA